jgi:hypothetical protein
MSTYRSPYSGVTVTVTELSSEAVQAEETTTQSSSDMITQTTSDDEYSTISSEEGGTDAPSSDWVSTPKAPHLSSASTSVRHSGYQSEVLGWRDPFFTVSPFFTSVIASPQASSETVEDNRSIFSFASSRPPSHDDITEQNEEALPNLAEAARVMQLADFEHDPPAYNEDVSPPAYSDVEEEFEDEDDDATPQPSWQIRRNNRVYEEVVEVDLATVYGMVSNFFFGDVNEQDPSLDELEA